MRVPKQVFLVPQTAHENAEYTHPDLVPYVLRKSVEELAELFKIRAGRSKNLSQQDCIHENYAWRVAQSAVEELLKNYDS